MKKLFAPVIRYGISKAKKSKFVQNLFESPFDLGKYPVFAEFTDSYGSIHKLHSGLRAKVRAPWKNLNKGEEYNFSTANLKAIKEGSEITAGRFATTIQTYGKTVEGSTILEVGCHSGGVSYAFAEGGAELVVGTEFSGYKVESMEQDNVTDRPLQQVSEGLQTLRQKVAAYYRKTENVQLVEDNIADSQLPAGTFDIIFSCDVLEHIGEPERAVKAMYRLLKQGGLMVHEYNPFFCLNGGHSLCTLDFLWGHARLNEGDFYRYIDTYRAEEESWAKSFYSKGLNRMTMADLTAYMHKAGLGTHAVLPFTKEQHLRMVDNDTLLQVKRLYPNASVADLVAPRVLVVAQKA